jgi:type IV secretory pathway TraG/TraD family ATPase VirD4
MTRSTNIEATLVAFGVNDIETAEHIQKHLGDHTILVEDGGTSTSTSCQPSERGGYSHSYTKGSSTGWRQHGRPLLRAEEVIRLSRRTALVFPPDAPPLKTRLIRYYEGDFTKTRSVAWVWAAVDAVLLFLGAALLAQWVHSASLEWWE